MSPPHPCDHRVRHMQFGTWRGTWSSQLNKISTNTPKINTGQGPGGHDPGLQCFPLKGGSAASLGLSPQGQGPCLAQAALPGPSAILPQPLREQESILLCWEQSCAASGRGHGSPSQGAHPGSNGCVLNGVSAPCECSWDTVHDCFICAMGTAHHRASAPTWPGWGCLDQASPALWREPSSEPGGWAPAGWAFLAARAHLGVSTRQRAQPGLWCPCHKTPSPALADPPRPSSAPEGPSPDTIIRGQGFNSHGDSQPVQTSLGKAQALRAGPWAQVAASSPRPV